MAKPDDAQRETIAFLADPQTHGGPVDSIDTHCSILFLTQEHAYKLKRAIHLPYLDYSTVTRRRAMCEAELQLNRRTASDLYEKVACISRDPDGHPQFDVSGEALDWVVVMRRFPAGAAFDHMADHGALTEDHVGALATAIARFHGAAEVHKDAGGAAAMAKVVQNNEEAFRAVNGGVFSEDDVTALSRDTRIALAAGAALLDQRRQAGKVRQCHGDLHLRNVVLWHEVPTPFDCIEFDMDLARIDVLYDLAFLLMDLEYRGLRRLANVALNTYLAAAGDWDGLALLPLFLSMRAAIRAHVNGTAGDRAAASSYLELARRFLTPAPAKLAAIGGLSGTGKSSVSRAIAPTLGRAPGAVVLRTDVLRKEIAGVPPTQRLPPEAYTKENSGRVYDLLNRRSRQILGSGHSVLADAVFADPAERRAIEGAAQSTGIFQGIWLEASAEILEARVAQRRGDASDATPEVVRAQNRYDLGDVTWRRVDASGTEAETVTRVKAALGLD